MALARNGCADPPHEAEISIDQPQPRNERRSRAFRSQALILKRRSMGEADRLLTLFTPRHGKIAALARGVRKASSRKSGHVELLMHSDLLLGQGRSFYYVQQAEMIAAFPRLREDLTRHSYGLYIADLLDHFFVGEEESQQPEFFAETLAALRALCEDEDPLLLLRHYELRLLTVTGFQPELQYCTISGQPLLPRDQFFSSRAGGVVSAEAGRAATEAHDLRPLAFDTLKLLRYLQRESYSRVKSLRLSARLHGLTEALLQGYIESILERRLASVQFLQRVRQRNAHQNT